MIRHGLGLRRMAPMAGDFSTRRYFRVTGPGQKTLILMDDPVPGSVRSFVAVARLLAMQAQASVPAMYAADLDHGFLLLEDLGVQGFGFLLRGGENPRRLYEVATQVLIEVQRRITPADCRTAHLPHFNAQRFRDQVLVFADHYIPAAQPGMRVSLAAREEMAAAWEAVLKKACVGVPESLLLRDYHIDNLMLLPDASRRGWQRVGLLDFQDAGLGPVSYDLMSLLEDARQEVPEDIIEPMQGLYRSAFPELDWKQFMLSYHILGAQRHCRVLARIADVAMAQGKTDKLALLPRVMTLFRAKLALPELAPVADWFALNFDLDTPIGAARKGRRP